MAGFRVLIAAMEGEVNPEPSNIDLTEGIIRLGGASDLMSYGAFADGSQGTDYGHGEAYSYVEMPYMAKVKSHNR